MPFVYVSSGPHPKDQMHCTCYSYKAANPPLPKLPEFGYVKNLAVSWHGIEYETIHSDILREIFRTPEEEPAKPLSERAMRVAGEAKFFPSYAHHVSISDHVADILKRIYMIPGERVHIILNGVDEAIFKPEVPKGGEFRRKLDIPDSKSLVLGMAGRLVRDKGYPFMFDALTQMFEENATFRETSVVLVAGDGPWAARYRNLGEKCLLEINLVGRLASIKTHLK
ncbi:hypothetical protein CJ030_MR1G005231 [Morella rubra]|uniref:Glycosyltransferase subfamily 4-like N-terminal domain-containing protein n=1 Tax=Morella rubra TaxID=262757 RepID=A0A6A1WL22_9ROSI|nr:hypothetical protein CJ030_MR1G005231 [Morella rubra]